MISLLKWFLNLFVIDWDDKFGKEPEWAITQEEIDEQLHLDKF